MSKLIFMINGADIVDDMLIAVAQDVETCLFSVCKTPNSDKGGVTQQLKISRKVWTPYRKVAQRWLAKYIISYKEE